MTKTKNFNSLEVHYGKPIEGEEKGISFSENWKVNLGGITFEDIEHAMGYLDERRKQVKDFLLSLGSDEGVITQINQGVDSLIDKQKEYLLQAKAERDSSITTFKDTEEYKISKGYKTAKECRHEIAEALIKDRKTIKEIEEDSTLSENEKNEKIKEIKKQIYNHENYIDYRRARERHAEIQNLKHDIKNEKDEQKKKELEKILSVLEKEYNESHDFPNFSIRKSDEQFYKNCYNDGDSLGNFLDNILDGKISLNENIKENIINHKFFENFYKTPYRDVEDAPGIFEDICRCCHKLYKSNNEEHKNLANTIYDKIVNLIIQAGGLPMTVYNLYLPIELLLKIIKESGGLDAYKHYYFEEKLLENVNLLKDAIIKTGGLREGTDITIYKGSSDDEGIWDCSDLYAARDKKWNSSTIKYEEEKLRRKELAQVNIEKLQIDRNFYKNLDTSKESIQKVIEHELKNIKGIIPYLNINIQKQDSSRPGKIKGAINSLAESIKGCNSLENIKSSEDIGKIFIEISKKIIDIYKHPGGLNGKPYNPDLRIENFSITQEGNAKVKMTRATGVSGTWVGNVKVDDPNYTTQSIVITPKGEEKILEEKRWNMRDLYE